MKIKCINFLLVLLVAGNIHAFVKPSAKEVSRIKTQLSKICKVDQAVRFELLDAQRLHNEKKFKQVVKKMAMIDRENTRIVKSIYKKWGWPRRETFGVMALQDFWLVTQHADLEFQKLTLSSLEAVAKEDSGERIHYAYLRDRVQAFQSLPQRYGTQGRCAKVGDWEPFPCENFKKIDLLRKEIGLGSFEEYKKLLDKTCF